MPSARTLGTTLTKLQLLSDCVCGREMFNITFSHTSKRSGKRKLQGYFGELMAENFIARLKYINSQIQEAQ